MQLKYKVNGPFKLNDSTVLNWSSQVANRCCSLFSCDLAKSLEDMRQASAERYNPVLERSRSWSFLERARPKSYLELNDSFQLRNDRQRGTRLHQKNLLKRTGPILNEKETFCRAMSDGVTPIMKCYSDSEPHYLKKPLSQKPSKTK